MKRTRFAAVIAFGLKVLGVDALPKGEDGRLALTPEQEAAMKKEFPDEKFEQFKKAANEVLEEEAGLDAEKQAAFEQLASVVNTPKGTSTATVAQTAAETIAEQRQTIEALSNAPVPDEAVRQIVGTGMKGKLVGAAAVLALSSTTHLFAENATPFMAFENRPWNQRAAGKVVAETDFSDTSTIARLNNDLKEYYVQNPQKLLELERDKFGLPTFWPKNVGVKDRTMTAGIMVANVTQARKNGFAPGADFYIDAEQRKVWPIQVDLLFEGYQLQQLETSWISEIQNLSGSDGYKTPFVAYLTGLIDAKARIEDRIACVKGIYVKTPKGLGKSGKFQFRQDGILAQLFQIRDVEKRLKVYKPTVGSFNLSNAVDYVKGFMESLSEEERIQPNLVWYWSRKNRDIYREAVKAKNALNNDYTGVKSLNGPEDYPNVRFEVMPDLEGTNIMFITNDKNIVIDEYIPSEKSKYVIQYHERDTKVMADYKLGAGFDYVGKKLEKGSPFFGKAQFVWINDEPIFPANHYAPIYGEAGNGILEVTFNKYYVDSNLMRDITTINGLATGSILKIKGNDGLTTTFKIKKKTAQLGNLDIATDFDPKTETDITLVKLATGLWKEVSRNIGSLAEADSTAVEFDTDAIDANEGIEFKYTGAASETLADILNGVDGTEITIYGQATNTLTVAAVAGKIVLISGSALLDAATKFIKLQKFEGMWFETSRG